MRLPAPLLRLNPKLHKNDFGHVLVVAGSAPMLGAGALVGLAAMRAGTGLVTIAVPQDLNKTLQQKISPVIMTWPLPATGDGFLKASIYPILEKRFLKYQSMVLGPGLGTKATTKNLVLKLIINFQGAMVIDADALNILADKKEVLLKAKGVRVVTPHAGEMAKLLRCSREEVEANRQSKAMTMARAFDCTVVLKGQHTLITDGDKCIFNKTGNVGMATAGSGDVLSGIIGAFLSQGIKPFDAATWGVYHHGLAGNLAEKKTGKVSMIATDLIDFLPQALKTRDRP